MKIENLLVGCVFSSVAVFCYSFWSNKKQKETLKNVSDTINMSYDVLRLNPNLSVANDVVETLIKETIKERLISMVKKEIDLSHKAVIKDRINHEVESYYSKIRKELEIELSQKIADQVDTNIIKREVERKATTLIEAKLDDKFDTILEAFNHNLATTSKIYESISETVKQNITNNK